MDISVSVKKIIIDHLGCDEAKATESANIIEDLGADSLDLVELAIAFEEAFHIEIPDDDAEKVLTVGDAIKYVEKALS